jgi:hypothetical protein
MTTVHDYQLDWLESDTRTGPQLAGPIRDVPVRRFDKGDRVTVVLHTEDGPVRQRGIVKAVQSIGSGFIYSVQLPGSQIDRFGDLELEEA